MKRRFFPISLLLTLFLCGCARNFESVEPCPNLANTEVNESNYASPVFENIVSEYIVDDNYVLVETKKDSYAPRFDLWNKQTNEVANLPTMPNYATVEDIINENCIIFITSGQNSESVSLDFPYYIKCFRVNDGRDIFWQVTERKKFSLDEKTRAGSDRECVLEAIDFSYDSINLCFKPKTIDDPYYSADIIDIPLTDISYDVQAMALNIELKNCTRDNNCLACDDILDFNPYITSYKIVEVGNALQVVLYLSNLTTGYFAEKACTVDAYLSVQLS